MTHPSYDVLVVGLGAMGSQTVAELARRGARVAGIDRFAPPHAEGSSHGRSRIIREAYFEDPIYVPLVQRAYARWAALETETGTSLFRRTGGLWYGRPDGDLIRGTLRSTAAHRLPHERLDATALRARFPAHRVDDDWVGILEPRAGVLDPERAIAAALTVAREHGATLRPHTTVTGWAQTADGVVVETDGGTMHAASVVLCGGMWMSGLAEVLAPHLTVQRNVLYWFDAAAAPGAFAPDAFPVFLGEVDPTTMFYGFPDTGDGIKVALHHHGASTTPTTVGRTVAATEVDAMRAILRARLPWADGPLRATAVCTYTNVGDGHFILDRHPRADRVWVASPCSGHGFKFSPAIGEVLADLALTGTTWLDLAPFRLDRLGVA